MRGIKSNRQIERWEETDLMRGREGGRYIYIHRESMSRTEEREEAEKYGVRVRETAPHAEVRDRGGVTGE